MRLRRCRQRYWLCLVLRSLAPTSRGTVQFPLTELDFGWISSFSACSPSGDHVHLEILLSQVCGGVCNCSDAHVKRHCWKRKIWRHRFRPPRSEGALQSCQSESSPYQKRDLIGDNCDYVFPGQIVGVWRWLWGALGLPPSGPTLAKLQGPNTVMMQPFIPSSWPAGLLAGPGGAAGGIPLQMGSRTHLALKFGKISSKFSTSQTVLVQSQPFSHFHSVWFC